MEVLSKTQFSELVSQCVEDMNPFIVKKLEEAIIRAYQKKYQGESRLSDKLERAQKRRNEQMDAMISKLASRNKYLEGTVQRLEQEQQRLAQEHIEKLQKGQQRA